MGAPHDAEKKMARVNMAREDWPVLETISVVTRLWKRDSGVSLFKGQGF